MEKLKLKLNIPQTILMSFIAATVMTIANFLIDWNNRIYAGIFAGLTIIVCGILANLMIRDKD
ncbi:hypothetical protein [Metabacillus indicus]|uniref:Uncharacterized protein n=1 Tax=Metabacillus indicus TaxID=246786 RepID=A0A084H0H8_METID|nr:hypothetical protein [Metabacillus indicus]KEZ50763.1 hypothetical protein AZ46_0208945 [Metabacillus indicus LMG 22858]KEZ53090.1 hypothetical protein GS18_0209805 [Metabacillus indicus]